MQPKKLPGASPLLQIEKYIIEHRTFNIEHRTLNMRNHYFANKIIFLNIIVITQLSFGVRCSVFGFSFLSSPSTGHYCPDNKKQTDCSNYESSRCTVIPLIIILCPAVNTVNQSFILFMRYPCNECGDTIGNQ